MNDRPDLASALAEAARTIGAGRDLASTLDTIVHVARDSLPEIDEVGVTIVHADGTVETKAATGQPVHDLDALQYEYGEGPCLHAIGAEPVVLVEHAGQERRWPRFMPRAVAAGVRAQLGLRLFVDGDTLGALSLYSMSSDTLGEDTVQVAELFAAHAAVALGRVRREETLTNALSSRKLVGQALGIVMERHSLGEERALEHLTRAAEEAGVTLLDAARELVERSNARTDRNPAG